jgi:hypothetical protein
MMNTALIVSRRLTLPKKRINRQFASFSFIGNGGGGGDFDFWPRSHPNTILNVCPQGELMVVERLGKLHSIQQAGLFFSIPVVDSIRYRIDVRWCAFGSCL